MRYKISLAIIFIVFFAMPRLVYAEELTPTPEPTLDWQSAFSTPLPNEVKNDECPPGYPLGWLTVTPSAMWELYCSHCITGSLWTPVPTITPTYDPLATSTPIPTMTPTYGPTLTTTNDWRDDYFEGQEFERTFTADGNKAITYQNWAIYVSQWDTELVAVSFEILEDTYSDGLGAWCRWRLDSQEMYKGLDVYYQEGLEIGKTYCGGNAEGCVAMGYDENAHGFWTWNEVSEWKYDCQSGSGTISVRARPIYRGEDPRIETPTVTPTPEVTETPELPEDGYCFEVEEALGGGAGWGMPEMPTIEIALGNCYGLNNEIPLGEWFGVDVTIPVIQVCVDFIRISDLDIFGASVNLNYMISVMLGVALLRIWWRS